MTKEHEDYSVQCDECDGTGVIVTDDATYVCTECKGEGYIDHDPKDDDDDDAEDESQD